MQCLLICIDLWKANLNHILIAPRARVAYNVGDYRAAKAAGHWEIPDERLVTGKWNQVEQVTWQDTPPPQLLLFDDGVRTAATSFKLF